MSLFFQTMLIGHVFLGLLAIAFSVAVFLFLTREKYNKSFLKFTSLSAFLSYLLSWLLGGYYYLYHYGVNVKPDIKAGDFAWAHGVIMETKEHVFLFLPFLAFILFLFIWSSSSLLEERKSLRKLLTVLALLNVILGVIVAFMGMMISGAAKL
jgi:hypothetical protein